MKLGFPECVSAPFASNEEVLTHSPQTEVHKIALTSYPHESHKRWFV
jgi:hypothetical protein